MSRERKNNRSKLGQAIRNGEPLSGVGAAGGDRVQTREPEVTVRDPVMPRKPRRYIPASMPCVCPDCGHGTRMDDGRHVDPVRQRILEYRTCAHCGAKLAAGRAMTPREAEMLCTRAEAVAEYEAESVVCEQSEYRNRRARTHLTNIQPMRR